MRKKKNVIAKENNRKTNLDLLRSIAEDNAKGELADLKEYDFSIVKFIFFKYPLMHEKFFKTKFPKIQYLRNVDDIVENYNYTYHLRQEDEIKNILLQIESILIMHKDGTIVLGMLRPISNIPSNIKFDKIAIIGTALYNFFYQQNKELLISNEEEKTFEELLQHIETQLINDLHIKAINEKQSAITARIGQDVVPLTNTAILNSYVADLIHQAKIMMKEETLEEPPEMTGLVKTTLINSQNMPVERTFRMNIVVASKGLEKVNSISIRRLMNLDEIEKLGMVGLGYSDKAIALLDKIKLKKHGVNIISGATNTGKSTVLAAILNQLDKEGLRIISIENPVEIVTKYDQIDLSITSGAEEKFRMTMERALKSTLRHDPDVILINEVRTKAEIRDYIELGLKGHMAWTTTHAGSAKATILKFFQATENPLDLIEALNGIIVQELVNKKCQNCNGEGKKNGKQCEACKGTGQKGIIPVYEILYFKNLGVNTMVLENGAIDFSKLFDFDALIKEDRIEYISKVEVAKELFENNIIFEKDWIRIRETENQLENKDGNA